MAKGIAEHRVVHGNRKIPLRQIPKGNSEPGTKTFAGVHQASEYGAAFVALLEDNEHKTRQRVETCVFPDYLLLKGKVCHCLSVRFQSSHSNLDTFGLSGEHFNRPHLLILFANVAVFPDKVLIVSFNEPRSLA